MKKGVAIPYIIALILGIVVVALLGYWFFVLGGPFTGKASLTQCQADLNIYCQGYSSSGYDSAYGDFTTSCADTTDAKTPECCSYISQLRMGTWEATCRALLG